MPALGRGRRSLRRPRRLHPLLGRPVLRENRPVRALRILLVLGRPRRPVGLSRRRMQLRGALHRLANRSVAVRWPELARHPIRLERSEVPTRCVRRPPGGSPKARLRLLRPQRPHWVRRPWPIRIDLRLEWASVFPCTPPSPWWSTSVRARSCSTRTPSPSCRSHPLPS